MTYARARATLILVVDDHPVNRTVLVKQVESLGYAADVAANGLEAIDKWSGGGYAAIVTECNMSELDGYDLARHIRASEMKKGAPRMPIIACTANALPSQAQRCLAAGMDDYIPRPISPERLRATLHIWLPLPGAIDAGVLAGVASGNADLSALVRAAHRIKGSAGAIGATELAVVCERLEAAGRAGDWSSVAAAMEAFERELHRLQAHIATAGE